MSDTYSHWRVPAGRRVPPVVRLPRRTEMLNNGLSLIRQPVPLAAACFGVAAGAYLQPRGMRPGHREIVIARTAWNVGGYFPYAAHNPIAALAAWRSGGQEAIQHGPADPQIMNIAAQVGLYETVAMTFGSVGFIPPYRTQHLIARAAPARAT